MKIQLCLKMCRTMLAILTAGVLGSAATAVRAQHTVYVEGEYTWDHTNLVPGCNCFGMQGGSGELGVEITPHVSALIDVTATHHSGLTPSGYSLTQTTATAGLRYEPGSPRAHVRPFGEALLGAATASGTASPSAGNYGLNQSFALQAGGGVLVPVGSRFSIVPAHVDYLLTTFGNGANGRQNQMRLSAGLQLRFGR